MNLFGCQFISSESRKDFFIGATFSRIDKMGSDPWKSQLNWRYSEIPVISKQCSDSPEIPIFDQILMLGRIRDKLSACLSLI